MLTLAEGKPRERAAARAQGASRARPGRAGSAAQAPAQNVTSFRRLAVVSEMRGRNVLWQSFTRCHASFLPPLAADGVSRVRGGGSAPRRSGPQRLPEPVPDGSRLQSSADSVTADGCSDSLRKWRTQARSRPWAHPAARPVTNRPGCGPRGCDMFECAQRRQSWTAYSKRLLPGVHVTSPG